MKHRSITLPGARRALVAAVAGLIALHSASGSATPINCNLGGSSVPVDAKLAFKQPSQRPTPGYAAYHDQAHRAKLVAATTARPPDGETLRGALGGSWDEVHGVVTFPFRAGNVDLLLVAYSLMATPIDATHYAVPGWQREPMFMDIGDGVPRLLSSYLLDPDFVPAADDPFFTRPGRLHWAPYVLYREFEEIQAGHDYSDYEFKGALADLRYTTDRHGHLQELIVDIRDVDNDYVYSVPVRIGDRVNPTMVGYELTQPDSVWLVLYFKSFQPIQNAPQIAQGHWVPGRDYTDPLLPAGFDAASLPMTLLMEGSRTNADGVVEYGYGPPKSLGYTWGDAVPLPELRFTDAANRTVVEGAHVQVNLSLSAPSKAIVSVPLRLGGSAVRPDDYSATSGVVSFAPGQTTASVTLALVDDQIAEPLEYVGLRLGRIRNAKPGAQLAERVRIDDND
ncbi:MAG: Calx-beta domain-containing protein [Sinimarinibacterium sp.]|jgi:hypothetical protein